MSTPRSFIASMSEVDPMSATLPSTHPERDALDRSWQIWAAVAASGFVVVSLILGLIVLPASEGGRFDPFAAICRAIGIPGYEKAQPNFDAAAGRLSASEVAWTVATLRVLGSANAGKGAVLAQDNCAACHGENGLAADPLQFPSLAGQSAAAIFKELRDFQTGARKSDLMAAIVQRLTQEQTADVAAYYTARVPADLMVAESGVPLEIGRLARQGSPARAIASCDSCHGPSRSGPEGTPILLGQSAPYLEQQLKDFGAVVRRNDLFERMRTIAQQLTPDEMHRLAIYYGGMPRSH
jgi:cytochrome c553